MARYYTNGESGWAYEAVSTPAQIEEDSKNGLFPKTLREIYEVPLGSSPEVCRAKLVELMTKAKESMDD